MFTIYLRNEFIKSSTMMQQLETKHPNVNESLEGHHVDSLQQQQF